MMEYDQPYDEYRSNPALGSTDVSNLNKSLRHFHDGRKNSSPTNAMSFGTLIHTLILQPDIFEKDYAIYEGNKTKASKEYKEFCLENEGKHVIKQSEYELAVQALTGVQKHWVYQYLQSGFPEVSLYGEVEGIECKGRIDYLSTNRKRIFDIKTIADISKWSYHVKDYSYHIQAYMYMRLLSEELDIPMSEIEMFFILIEKKADCMYVDLRVMDEGSLLVAENQIIEALGKYKQATSNNIDLSKTFPYPTKPLIEGLPPYFINSYFKEMEIFQ